MTAKSATCKLDNKSSWNTASRKPMRRGKVHITGISSTSKLGMHGIRRS